VRQRIGEATQSIAKAGQGYVPKCNGRAMAWQSIALFGPAEARHSEAPHGIG